MKEEIKIIPPKGYEVDKENSTFECIKFKPIVPQLPKTWEEFCDTHPIKKEEAYISNISSIIVIDGKRDSVTDKNLLPSEGIAKAILALCQLIQLRDCYNDGWKPDWTDCNVKKYCIYPEKEIIITGTLTVVNEALTFKSEKLRDKFLENFKDLIEIAKPLL